MQGLARYVGGAVLVRLADEGAQVVMALLAVQRLGNVAVGAALVTSLLVPHVLAAPVVGTLGDRARRPALLVAGAATGFAGALALAALLLGRVPVPVVCGVLLVGGCCGPALTGALSSQLSRLIPEAELPRAFGVDALTYNVAGIAGPAVAAVLTGAASAPVAALTLAAGATAGAVLIATLPTRGEPATASFDLSAFTGGARAIVRIPPLRVVTGVATLTQAAVGALPIVATVVASRTGDPTRAGWLLTAIAIGGVVGSAVWTWRPAPARVAPLVVMAALVVQGAPLLLAAVLAAAGDPPLLLLVGLFAVSGLADGPFIGALFVSRDRFSPAEVRTQVFTLSAGARTTAAAAGSALAGIVAGASTAVLLAAVGAVPVAAAVAGFAGLALTRRKPGGGPAAVP